MSHDPAGVLKKLFAIAPSQIDRDIAAGREDFDRLMTESRASHLEQRNSRDPEVAAIYHHKQMVRASACRDQDNLPLESRLYFAAMAADRIAEEAVSVAQQQGQIAELASQMSAIERREGLKETEAWPLGQGPEDYRKLSAESEALHTGVYDTVFTSILRRYQMDDFADLFENHRDEYDAIWERGRKLMFEGAADG